MARDRRILLVGGTGRVGRMVLHHWRAAPPVDVEIIEQHRDPSRDGGLYWPLLESPKDPLGDKRIDAIVCLAGVTPGPDADLSLNKTLAEAVLKAAHLAGIKRVLLASSSAVYGASDGTPFAETSATLPVNAYGEAKLATEAACAPWREAGLEVCCLRIGNVAGADALLLNATRSPDPLRIDCFADGRGPVRSYIGARTLGDVLMTLSLSDAPLPPLLNMAAPGTVFMEDLARAAAHPFTYRSAPDGAYQQITLDCAQLAALHIFAPEASDPAQMVHQWKETLPR